MDVEDFKKIKNRTKKSRGERQKKNDFDHSVNI